MSKNQVVREVPNWDPIAFSDARIAAGYTWRQMSAALGVPQTTLHNLSRTGFPSAALLKSAASLLRVPQKQLLR